jgi:hypothetical protein
MRTIEEVYLTSNSQPKILSIGSNSGIPTTQKTTPTIQRVPASELELTYLHNPLIFNGINKIVQTVMSAEHELVCKDPKVKKYFLDLFDGLGNSGSDITWEELLSSIYKYQCIYGKAWIENVYNKKGNAIVDWDLIDPKKMDYLKTANQQIALDVYGNALGYVEALPYGISPKKNQQLPKELEAKGCSLPLNGIFLEPKRVAQLKLFSIGDGFYPIGLIEPIYKTSLRKLNIEEALANAIWRHGFPTFLAKIGDANHEPTPQQVQNTLDKLRDSSFKQELAVPYFTDLSILESKKSERLREHLEYFQDQEVAGLGIPKPFCTGGGEATNRATLGNQQGMFQLTLRDITEKTIDSIRKYMFKPICDLEGFKEIPSLRWDVIGTDEINDKSRRLINYLKAGVLTTEQVSDFIKRVEKL